MRTNSLCSTDGPPLAHARESAPVLDARVRLDQLRVEINELIRAEESTLRRAQAGERRRRRIIASLPEPVGMLDEVDLLLERLDALLITG